MAGQERRLILKQNEQSSTTLIIPKFDSLAHFQGKQEGREVLEGHMSRMLKIKEEVLGRDHPLILDMLMNLASMYQEQGRWKDAEGKAMEVVGKRKRKNPEHPSTITAMIRLGSIYISQGRWEDAEEMQLQSIDASSEMEVNAPERLLLRSHLASNYSHQGRLSEAERLQVQVMEGNITQFGREHFISLNSRGNLSLTYMRQGKWKEAETLALHVVNSRQTSLGTDHHLTLSGMGNLVKVYRGQERWEEAERLAMQVLDKKKKIFGERHPKTLRPIRDLAVIWHARKRHKEALVLMSKVVDFSETALGSDHPDTIGRKQCFDEWASEASQYPPAGDDEGARMMPKSHGTGTFVQEGLTKSPQVTTESTQNVDCAADYEIRSKIRGPDSRKRQKLTALERQSTSSELPQVFQQKARQVRDLLIEYGID